MNLPNGFYCTSGVSPPKPGSIWIVYEYAGLSTVQTYSVPGEVRRAAIPVRKGWFGSIIEPAPLPQFRTRANYVINGIMKQGINSVAILHENGFVHRSIGRSSFILSSTSMDLHPCTMLPILINQV